MGNKLNLFLLQLIVIIIARMMTVVCDGKGEKECLADYLKKNDILNASFESEAYTNTTEVCEQIVIKIVSEFNDDIEKRIVSENYTHNRECMMENIEKYGIIKKYLKAYVFHLFGKISMFKKKVATTKNKLLISLDKTCNRNAYEVEFDLINSAPLTVDENILCIQKMYFQMEIMKASEFKINVANITSENCTDNIRDLPIPPLIERNYFGLKAEKVKKCYKKYFIAKKVSLRMASSIVFKSYNLTDEQLAKIRKHYVEWMLENQHNILLCIHKNL
jgi:hypothetical protein